MNSKTKNDIAWEKIFSQFKILKELESKEYYLISSEQIKEFREPRLMTKFDHKKTFHLFLNKTTYLFYLLLVAPIYCPILMLTLTLKN